MAGRQALLWPRGNSVLATNRIAQQQQQLQRLLHMPAACMHLTCQFVGLISRTGAQCGQHSTAIN